MAHYYACERAMSHQTLNRLIMLATLCLAEIAFASSAVGKPTLDQVRSYEYLVSESMGTAGISTIIANSPSDLIIMGGGFTDPALDRSVADPAGKKLIFGYICPTEADSWRYPALFSSGSHPSWFGKTNPVFTFMYSVQYWNPAWKALIYSSIDTIVARGYDGIFLDVMDGDSEWAAGNSLGNPAYPNAVQALATLLSDIRSYITSKNLSRPFYLMANNPTQIAIQYPSSLNSLDAIFNEVAYWNSNGVTSTSIGTGDAQWKSSTIAPLYKASGLPIFGNDYPVPLSDPTTVLPSFQYYSSLGWIPSVANSAASAQIFSTGPFMFTAVSSNATATGTPNFVNYLSGGLTSAATLIGGDQGDYFLGGPGQNTIQGGAGNDVIYAHPASSSQKNLLALSSYGHNTVGITPTISVLINGKVALPATAITAQEGSGQTQSFEFDTTPYGSITSLVIAAGNESYVDAGHFNNVYISSLAFNGSVIALSSGTYSAYSSVINNQVQLNGNGTATFSASVFQTPSPFLANTSNIIDGGGGFNTAIYRAALANYTISQNPDTSWLITSATTSEGPDTLKNIQLLQFTDAQAVPVGKGWNLLGNSTGSPITVATMFNDAVKIASVWKWDAANTKWCFYSPSLSAQALSEYASSKNYELLTTINVGEGFWISTVAPNGQQLPPGASAPATVFQATGSKPLGKGWNLVSTSDGVTPAQFAATQGSTVNSVWAYDNPTGNWYFYAPSLAAQGGTALSDYITAHGYLDFTSASKTLGPGVGFWVEKP